MNRHLVFAFLALGLGCATTDLPNEPVFGKELTFQGKDFQLKSGLRVLVQEDHSDPTVTISVVYNAGCAQDPKGKEGTAHFVEHLAFRTKPFGDPAIWETLKRLGVDFNAETRPDETVYYEVGHKDNLRDMLDMEAKRMLQPMQGVTEEEFKTEREVVRNEMRLRKETNINNRLFDLLFERAFPKGHPLGRPMAGTVETNDRITLEDAREFTKKYYRPDNATMIIAGDVTKEEVGKLLGTLHPAVLFNNADPNAPAVPPRRYISETPIPEPPPPVDMTLGRVTGPVTTPLLLVGWSVPGAHRGNTAVMSFAATVLERAIGKGLSDASGDEEDEGEVISASAGLMDMQDSSLVAAFIEMKPGTNPEKIRKRVLDSLANAWYTDVDVEEGSTSVAKEQKRQMEFAKWSTATGVLLRADGLAGRATGAAIHLANTGSTAYLQESLNELSKVQHTQLTEFAYRWLTRDRAVSVYIEPESNEMPKITAGGGPSMGITKAGEHDMARGASANLAKEAGPDQILKIARAPGLDKLDRFKLGNGLEVVVAPRRAIPLARVLIGIKGGDASVAPYGLADLAWNYSRSTCMDHSDARYGLRPIGGRFGGGSGRIYSQLVVTVPAGNIGNGIAALGDFASCIEVGEEAFMGVDAALKRAEKRYARDVKRPEYVAGQALWAALYPNHPYGRLDINPSELRSVTLATANAFIKQQVQPGNALAVVAGDVETDEVKRLSEKYFARWQGGGGMGTPPAPPPGPTARKVILVDRPKATQAEIQIGCRIDPVQPETLAAYDLVSGVLTEELSMLREKWGATYGVYGGATYLPGSAHVRIGGAIENAQVGTSLVKILKIVEKVGAGETDENTVLLKRWDHARQYSHRFSGSSSAATHILAAAEYGWPNDVWEQYPKHLSTLDRKSLGTVVKPCVGKEIISIAGDASIIRPQILAVGLPLAE